MAPERKPQQVVLYVELEDNVGQILAKRKVEVPVTHTGKALTEEEVIRHFENYVKSLSTTNLAY